MSHTDKTKPWWLRVDEHKPWADHDHSDGICDLPASYRDNNPSGAGHCRWSDWNICHKGACCYGCGCRMCSGFYWRRAERRRERHRARTQTRSYTKGGEW